jgi:hypothetical protein
MPGVDFELLRERISMADVLRLLDFQPCNRRGDSYAGRVRSMVRRVREAVRSRRT